MAHTRKQKKQNSSRGSSVPSSPTQSQTCQSAQEKKSKSKETKGPLSRDKLITPSSTQPPSGITHQTTNTEELPQKVAANTISSSCKLYGIPELSDQVDKHGRRMIAYPCKTCGIKINRPTSDSSCSNLIKHASNCLPKQNEVKKTRSLASLGIKGTGEIDPKEVPQLCALWCAEAARPFSALVDASHQAILHPTVNYQSILKEHTEVKESGDIKLESTPLDFLRLSQSHTGEYLAKTVNLVVEKFGIQHKICGIVTDNASNNKVMVKELKKMKWPRFKGEAHWVCCFAHVLNLIVKGILQPFGSQKQVNISKKQSDFTPSDSDSESNDDAAEQIRAKDESLDEQENKDSESLSLDNIEHPSNEEDGDRYTTACCKETLCKFCAIAKKLRFSPNSKAEFVDIRREKGCETPHTVERDVRTQWNSTHTQLLSIIRCEAAILEWQCHKQHGVHRKYYLEPSDFDLAHDLANVLNLFYKITLQISVLGLDCLSNVVIYIDQITNHLLTAISGTDYPPALRNTIAIILHPSFRDKYFKLANWETDWIAEAIRLTREMWVTFYRPKPVTPIPTSSSTPSSKAKTGMLARLGSSALARGGHCSSDPLDIWLAGGLILDGNKPVNPLEWLIQQKCSRNTHGGLVNMALDVLSCPGELNSTQGLLF
ncbi:hypothetical protein PTTG_08475 [Puccinia triticina 1-1 BBBD Race 1]|uniref:DUF659 domain-containing protein n=1 Tax=Puccinia triticina (isolate 1-1 / race 1 (BBBD)) TaxID=630390 RepID=A0A180G4N4_PUCT1|nr:hypothetical protein PTTG_08475 [Puccinia triticina 1-1 BBBD Race 1]